MMSRDGLGASVGRSVATWKVSCRWQIPAGCPACSALAIDQGDMRNDPALDLLCSYLEAEDPSYLVRLDNHHERVSVVWSNGAAQQLASDVPGVVLAACLVTLQGDSAQHRAKRRRRLDSTWQLTVLEGAEDMPLAVITRISPAAPSSTLSESFDLHALLSACEVPNGVRSEDQHDFLKVCTIVQIQQR
jgi:hypothetical protein